MDRLNI